MLTADFLHHFVGNAVGRLRPGVDDLVVLFTLGDQAVGILLLVFLDQVAGFLDDNLLGFRNNDVVLAERDPGAGGFLEAQRHHLVGEDHRRLLTAVAVDDVDEIADFLLGQVLVQDLQADVFVVRQQGGDLHAAGRRVDDLGAHDAVRVLLREAALDLGVHRHGLAVQGLLDFVQIAEDHAFADFTVLDQRQIVEAEHDILRRHDDRTAVGRREDVVGRHHQHAGFELGFQRQRHVDGHLVAVEVGVEGRADQRVKLDGLAFDQLGFERLNAQAVQRRRAVEHDRVFADDLFEDIPHLRLLALDHALGLLDGTRQALGVETGVDERLEQFQRHLLRDAALVQLQFRTDGDDRTAGIVDALAQQVLAEAALLALQHVGERLQRTLVGAGDDAAAAAVVEQGVDRFLQHALFVADDDVRRAQFHQPLQAVVTVDDAAVQVVEVGRGEAATVQRHQRTQFRRNDRHDSQDHPFRTVAGFHERFDQLQALGVLLRLHFRGVVDQVGAQLLGDLGEVHADQHVAHGFGADFGGEAVIAEFFLATEILVFRQELVQLQRGQAGLGDDVVFEVKNAFDVLQRHVEDHGDPRRQRLQEPDVGNRRGQFDVTHAFAPDARQGDFDTALFADNALVLHALVLAAQTFVVLGRTEDAGAEQAVAFGLERAVVDGFGLLDLTERPRQDLFRRSQGDTDLVEGRGGLDRVENIEDFLVHSSDSICAPKNSGGTKIIHSGRLREARGGFLAPSPFNLARSPARRSDRVTAFP